METPMRHTAKLTVILAGLLALALSVGGCHFDAGHGGGHRGGGHHWRGGGHHGGGHHW